MDATKAVLKPLSSEDAEVSKPSGGDVPSGMFLILLSIALPILPPVRRGSLDVHGSCLQELPGNCVICAAKAIARQQRREAAMRARGVEPPAKKRGDNAVC